MAAFVLLLWAWLATPGFAQTFPPLTSRVVDNANLLSPEQEAAISAKLEALEQSTTRQLVVATVADLQGYPIEDYGYRLGRAWGIGQKEQNNGVILLVAPNDRKMRIEVGYGLEPYLTDALSSVIIREQIRPRFQAGDFPAGINAGVDAIIAQLQLPADQAQARQGQILDQARAQSNQQRSSSGGFPFGLIFWGIVLLFVLSAMRRGSKKRGAFGSRRYRRDSNWPVWLWVASELAEGASRNRGGWGGGGFGGGGGWGGGGGGFSGGGGSFGGGGASGDW